MDVRVTGARVRRAIDVKVEEVVSRTNDAELPIWEIPPPPPPPPGLTKSRRRVGMRVLLFAVDSDLTYMELRCDL